jgi:sulfur-carrier protein
MAVLLLFGPARTAAGTARVAIDAASVSALCAAARDRFGAGFADVLANSAVWVNGEPLSGDPGIGATDEVAVVPPVSGGA